MNYMERITKDRTVRRIVRKTPGYKKKKGRPRKRWKAAVLEDLRDKGIADWGREAIDTEGWKRITKLWA